MFLWKKKSKYEKLKKKWITRHRKLQERLWEKHKSSLQWIADNPKKIAIGSLGSLLMLAAPQTAVLPMPHVLLAEKSIVQEIDKNSNLVKELLQFLPAEVQPLTVEQEQTVSGILSREFGFRVIPEIGDKRLDRSYGYIGQEQHLARYPGDTMDIHFDSQDDAVKYGSQGMAPGLGAWGYFAFAKDTMTQKDVLREKYYIAVQTFLAPNFTQLVGEYRDFFKYRKMLVVNPENGKAIVVVIGDAGPAPWTRKHLGGSPEVMKHLERVDGAQKGPVLYFFIDDPDDKIPLGPIEVGKTV